MRRRRYQYSTLKWMGGIILISLGIGMFLAVLLPYCIPFLALLLIAAGIWLIIKVKRC